ncbi:hypothetical protein [Methanobacterium sp.]|uniref:hypothetical protein n=1 Tax=Methanobacterium sp. TaxID=2164 RepID=UPI003C76B2CE
MVNTYGGNNFEISHCPKCDTRKLGIIDLDEYNQVLIFRCNKCGEEFTKPVEKIVSNNL